MKFDLIFQVFPKVKSLIVNGIANYPVGLTYATAAASIHQRPSRQRMPDNIHNILIDTDLIASYGYQT